MKTLHDYIEEISTNDRGIKMKSQRIMVEQNDGNEVLWNSNNDRWSRKAKHRMNLPAKETTTRTWEKGEMAIYEGQEVEVLIPAGPNLSVGIKFNGQTKMVHDKKLTKLDEGVLGSMTQLSPINRMMQLAGISSPTIIEPSIIESGITETADDTVITEVDMFSGLFNKHFLGDFKNNATAARIATIGDILVGLNSQIDEIKDKIDQTLLKKIEMVTGVGMLLKNTANQMKTATPPVE